MIPKFKAFDTINNKMSDVYYWDFSKNLISINEGDNTLTDEVGIFIPLQFTEHFDKNGKELFWDDIVIGYYREQKEDKNKAIKLFGVVSKDNKIRFMLNGCLFVEKCLCKIMSNPPRSRCEFYWVNYGHNNIPDIGYCIDGIEQVGNIHQHPNLLEV